MDRSVMESPLDSLKGINQQTPFQSPFLQIDPKIFTTPDVLSSSEFIFPDGGTKPTRGRFEMAFSQIGGSIMTGGFIGGSIGAFKGLREISKMNESLAVKRSHLLNFITRTGATTASTFGSITLIYSAIGVGLSFIQDEHDDINTLIAATTTGTLYGALSRSKALDNLKGPLLTKMIIKRSAIGFIFGALAASTMIYLLNPESKLLNRIKNF